MPPRDVATTILVTAVWGVAFVGIKEVIATGRRSRWPAPASCSAAPS